eukprot:Skav224462  [mRNA]  locus=scaffold1302:134417:144371:+ [translate_table: standard]
MIMANHGKKVAVLDFAHDGGELLASALEEASQQAKLGKETKLGKGFGEPTGPCAVCGRSGGWMVGWLDGWMAGWLDGWMVGWLDSWVLKDAESRISAALNRLVDPPKFLG